MEEASEGATELFSPRKPVHHTRLALAELGVSRGCRGL